MLNGYGQDAWSIIKKKNGNVKLEHKLAWLCKLSFQIVEK